MIVVSDTTPLITLMKISKLDLLKDLFGEILIPEAVFNEVTGNSTFKEEADLIKDCSYVKVVTISDKERVNLIQRVTGLDLGETEAIVYADEYKADILLMDETKGRQVAKNMNIPLSGSIGILLEALEKGLINPADMIDKLEILKESNRRISDKLLKIVTDKALEIKERM